MGRVAGNHPFRVATCSTAASTALPRLRGNRFIFHLPRVQLWPTRFAPSLNLTNHFPSLLCQACAPPNKVLVTSNSCPLSFFGLGSPLPAAGLASLINPKPGSSHFPQLSSIWSVCKWSSSTPTLRVVQLSVFAMKHKEDSVKVRPSSFFSLH